MIIFIFHEEYYAPCQIFLSFFYDFLAKPGKQAKKQLFLGSLFTGNFTLQSNYRCVSQSFKVSKSVSVGLHGAITKKSYDIWLMLLF